MTVSQRAIAVSARPAQKPQRVCCPNCEATFDLNKIGKPRSPEQHRRFWAVMKAAFHHWPEGHDEQFATMNDLRIWLTMKAGWREEVARVPISGMKIEQAKSLAQAMIAAAGSHAAVRAHKNSLVVFRPKSVAYQNMGHLEFCKLNDEVSGVIKSEIGITADELLSEAP